MATNETAASEMVAVTVDVTQEDVDRGIRADCVICPVAIAVRRRFRGLGVVVGNNEILLNGGKFTTPRAAAEFIDRFDDGEPVSPFTFTLEVPAALASLPVAAPSKGAEEGSPR